ncbi:radical SAM protein [Streptomyces sp. HUCO-GS316]|uniref:CUAEP/CCAEP-tail radical SAM (seleno)protein n=1 Tax=Streptomyces sp. HUCO-GS316 TaxID=2692198 RepID=UPI001369D091|nr:CUAEP/CCAEP-tail radical SAM protein [Streptomyces sp. HUCO-GS316]MXM64275.1 radical SAM protein [Streptomyces sp. HUCO-GS316]
MDHVVLISTYELGRQSFGLASPAAWLKAAGAEVVLQDLAVSAFDADCVQDALLIGVHVPMHTATRMAEPILRRLRMLNRRAHICVYGLYAPMNADHLRSLGADSILGGEFEESLVGLYRDLIEARTGHGDQPVGRSVVSLGRQQFLVPDRTGLPGLERYAALLTETGQTRTVGYTEASRGCKHLCRHCPVVPVYGGRFRVVQIEPVLDDIRQQVAAGAEHITFGDPDFFNAPTHSMKIVTRLHEEFPELSYDVTIKVEHLRKHADLIPTLKRTGCVLVTTAVEAVDDDILQRLDKNHTAEDLNHIIKLLRDVGLAFNPTFVAFTPWTTLPGYAEFLQTILRLELVDLVSPVQYGIRLLIPSGSRLLELDEVRTLIRDFDPHALAHPWSNPDPEVDRLHQDILQLVKTSQKASRNRREIFTHVWRTTFNRLGADTVTDPDLSRLPASTTTPQLTEPWYCCAEPTDEQLAHL